MRQTNFQVPSWIFELDFQVGFFELGFPGWIWSWISNWIFELDFRVGFRVGFSIWIFELGFRVGFSSKDIESVFSRWLPVIQLQRIG